MFMKVVKCKTRNWLIAILLLLGAPQLANSAIYFSRQSGNWNATSTWSTTGYGGAAAASTPGAAAGDVVMISGYTVTVTATPTNAVLAITISQNNNTGNDTKLDLNSAGIVLTANSMSVIDNNRNNHVDVSVSSTARLQINGSVSATRSTSNDRDKRLRFNILNSGRMNVTGNFTYTYGRAANNESIANEIQLDNSGRLDVTGNMTITVGNNSGNKNNFEFEMNSTSVCNIGGNLSMTLSNTNDDDLLSLIMNGGTLTVSGTCNATVASSASGNSSSSIYMYNSAVMSTGAFTYSHGGADYNNHDEFVLSNTSSLTINGDYTVTYGSNNGGGTDFDFVMNNTASFYVTGNTLLTLSNTNDGDDYYFDLNGGTFLVSGTLTATIAASATGGNSFDFELDGASATTGAFTVNHGGGGNGDVNIKLNSSSTSNPSALQVNGNLTLNHTGGDNMEIETNANSTLTVTGQLATIVASSSDGDLVYLDFNGGTATFNSIYGLMSSGATSGNFYYFTIDGATVNVTNDVSVYQQGGGGSGDIDFWLNQSSTSNPTVFNVGGNMMLSHSGGDNMEIEINDNVTMTVTGNLTDSLVSTDGDDFLLDINGGTLTVQQNYYHVQTTSGGTTEDLDLRIDGTGIFNVTGNVEINQQYGGQVVVYLNVSNGSTAQMNVGGNCTVTHGASAQGVYFQTDRSSVLAIGGNFTINNNASGGDLARIRMQNTPTLTVGGSLSMNLLSGTTGSNNNIELDMNGGTLSIADNLNMNGFSGKDALVTLDGSCTVTVGDTLYLNHTGGNLTYVYLGNSSGSPVLTLGALKLIDSGGGQSRFRMWNSSSVTVNGDVILSAATAAQVDIAVYNTSRFKLKGNFIRAASPSRYGILSVATSAFVEYIGTSGTQTLAGDAGSGGDGFTYGNVIFNNTSSACPSILMTATEGVVTIPAGCNLTFTDGVVSSSASAYIIIANTATVSGASDASYVEGPIRKVGNQSFTFPIGGSFVGVPNYQPATISAPSNNTHHFTAEYQPADPNGSYSVASRDASLNHVSRNEYWIINRTNGASNVNVTLNWDGSSGGVSNMPQLRVARWDGAVWRDQGNGGTTGSNAVGSVITSSAVTTFAATSPFTLTSTTTNNPLPIELVQFDAIPVEKQVNLVWSTANEKNNDHFVLERSENGRDFIALTSIPGAINSNTLRNYNWNDIHPVLGRSYYRLKQVDEDGAFSFSPVRSVLFSAQDALSTFSVYPNPSNGNFIKVKLKDVVKTSASSSDIEVELFDMNGLKVYSASNLFFEDEQGVTLKFENPLKPGVYAITITTEDTIEKQLLVIS